MCVCCKPEQAVEQTRFAGVADGDDVRINNHETGAWTRGLSARPPWGIVARAMAEVGKEEDYSVYELNCEEFATRMRYGEGWSSQVHVEVILVSWPLGSKKVFH